MKFGEALKLLAGQTMTFVKFKKGIIYFAGKAGGKKVSVECDVSDYKSREVPTFDAKMTFDEILGEEIDPKEMIFDSYSEEDLEKDLDDFNDEHWLGIYFK